jgi:hypothetical protein
MVFQSLSPVPSMKTQMKIAIHTSKHDADLGEEI